MKYYQTEQATSTVAHKVSPETVVSYKNEWLEKSQKMQKRRWRKIRHHPFKR